ncbi:S4 RNA-binding domain-containing protein, partial [Haematococcus lacustris]
MVEHFEAALTQVRNVPVETSRIPLSQLSVPLPRTDELSSTEASLRVDALASAGFRMSRSKMADMVKAGDVRVNWKTVTKASVELKAGDVISVSGKGRLEIKSVQTTKKERFAVVMTRFV